MFEMVFWSTAWRFQAGHDVNNMPLPLLVFFLLFWSRYSYVATVPLLVVFSVVVTILKYREGPCSVPSPGCSTQQPLQIGYVTIPGTGTGPYSVV